MPRFSIETFERGPSQPSRARLRWDFFPASAYAGFAENEHLCLELAGAVGLSVTRSSVMFFEDEPAFVAERFDRVWAGETLLRVPTEDFCQALAIHPDDKYQNMGGPGAKQMFQLLTHESSEPREDCARLFDALAFNYLVAGPDAHAKNYSLLQGGGRVRLAPLYDIASSLPYHEPRQLQLAMKIGSHYDLTEISSRDWDATGALAGLEGSGSERVRELAAILDDKLPQVVTQLRDSGLSHSVVETLQKGLHLRVHALR